MTYKTTVDIVKCDFCRKDFSLQLRVDQGPDRAFRRDPDIGWAGIHYHAPAANGDPPAFKRQDMCPDCWKECVQHFSAISI
jgi:hypothetical protein